MLDWTKSLIGMSLDAAIDEASMEGYSIRVGKWNDKYSLGTRDYRTDRLNVECVRQPPETPDWIIGKINGVG